LVQINQADCGAVQAADNRMKIRLKMPGMVNAEAVAQVAFNA
jgi:hypothetical protein